MAACPVCNKDMTYNDQYSQWYCEQCRTYPYHRSAPMYPYPPPLYPPPYPMVPPPADRRESRTLIIVIVVVIILVVIGPIIIAGFLYLWVMDLAEEGDDIPYFPTIEVILEDNGPSSEDHLEVRIIQGGTLDWSDHKIIITNNSDETDIATMSQLGILGSNSADEIAFIDSSVTGFADINYQAGKSYALEIYNLDNNKRTYYKSNLICE